MAYLTIKTRAGSLKDLLLKTTFFVQQLKQIFQVGSAGLFQYLPQVFGVGVPEFPFLVIFSHALVQLFPPYGRFDNKKPNGGFEIYNGSVLVFIGKSGGRSENWFFSGKLVERAVNFFKKILQG